MRKWKKWKRNWREMSEVIYEHVNDSRRLEIVLKLEHANCFQQMIDIE